MPRSSRPCQGCFERQPQHKGLLCRRCFRASQGLQAEGRERRPVQRVRVLERVVHVERPRRDVAIGRELFEVVWDGAIR